MSKRVRIFLAALALAVVATVMVLIWSSGPKDMTPQISFTLLGYTNNIATLDGSTPKIAMVKLTNPGTGPLVVTHYEVVFERKHATERVGSSIHGADLNPGRSATFSVLVCLYDRPGGKPPVGSKTENWQLVCVLERRTLSNRIRRALLHWPVVCRYIAPPTRYSITSEWFSQ
jgi:hypothetical protein